MGVGRGTRGPWSHLDLKNLSKKGCFLSFKWEKTNFTTFGLSWKNFGKIRRWPLLQNVFQLPWTQPLALALVTIITLNTFSEGLSFAHLITLTMETALNQKKFLKILNENCSAYFHLKLSPNFYKTRKSCKNLCGKVKPITSGGLNYPTSSFTARVIIANEKKTYFRFVSV